MNSAAIGLKESRFHCWTTIIFPDNIADHALAITLTNLEIIAVFGATTKIGKAIIEYLSANERTGSDRSILLGDLFFGPRQSNPNFGRILEKLTTSRWLNAWREINQTQSYWSFSGGRGKSQPDHICLMGISVSQLIESNYHPFTIEQKMSDHTSQPSTLFI